MGPVWETWQALPLEDRNGCYVIYARLQSVDNDLYNHEIMQSAMDRFYENKNNPNKAAIDQYEEAMMAVEIFGKMKDRDVSRISNSADWHAVNQKVIKLSDQDMMEVYRIYADNGPGSDRFNHEILQYALDIVLQNNINPHRHAVKNTKTPSPRRRSWSDNERPQFVKLPWMEEFDLRWDSLPPAERVRILKRQTPWRTASLIPWLAWIIIVRCVTPWMARRLCRRWRGRIQ